MLPQKIKTVCNSTHYQNMAINKTKLQKKILFQHFCLKCRYLIYAIISLWKMYQYLQFLEKTQSFPVKRTATEQFYIISVIVAIQQLTLGFLSSAASKCKTSFLIYIPNQEQSNKSFRRLEAPKTSLVAMASFSMETEMKQIERPHSKRS